MTDKNIASMLLGAAISFALSWMTYRFIKRREMIETRQLDDERQKEDRVRKEVLRWASPVLGSVKELAAQLRNLIEDGGFAAMSPDFKKNPSWSISYEYFMNSLVFLFGQYFACIRMFQEELSYELFKSHHEKDIFLKAVVGVRHALSSWPPAYACEGNDTQLFAFQQRVIGDLFIIREAQSKRCMSYAEFLERFEKPEFRAHFQPLIDLLDGICPQEECRWKRVKATREALAELEKVCKEFLEI